MHNIASPTIAKTLVGNSGINIYEQQDQITDQLLSTIGPDNLDVNKLCNDAQWLFKELVALNLITMQQAQQLIPSVDYVVKGQVSDGFIQVMEILKEIENKKQVEVSQEKTR